MLRGIAIVLVLLVASGCDRAEADLSSFTLEVEGMECGACVEAITHAIAGIDGVSSCEVSLEDGTATVQGDPALAETVATAVRDLQFTVELENES